MPNEYIINALQTIIILVMCHLIGDYVLQTRFIAESKDKYIYHLFVHCALYTLPFLIVFGFTWHACVIFITHMIIDPLKAKYHKLSYLEDQVLHYLICLIYFI